MDIEFSIGGAFSDAMKLPVAEPRVWCDVDGKSEGLGFMLDTFRRYDIQTTFFVETLHRLYFKHDPMRPIACQIHAAGHEVQLHVHPCWALFQDEHWREKARLRKGLDNFAGRSVADSARLIRQGIATFEDWDLPRPLAFRSGNMEHDDRLYQALAEVGIPYSSNVATGIYDSGAAGYELYSGQHTRHGVLELPILTFCDWQLGPVQHIKSLTIIGSSFSETRYLLEKAHEAGIPLVVLLTHPFEYIQSRDLAFRQTRRNSQTQRRVTELCKFLHHNSDRFMTCGLASAGAALPATAPSANILLTGALEHTMPRMVSQVMHHKFGQLMLARKYGN